MKNTKNNQNLLTEDKIVEDIIILNLFRKSRDHISDRRQICSRERERERDKNNKKIKRDSFLEKQQESDRPVPSRCFPSSRKEQPRSEACTIVPRLNIYRSRGRKWREENEKLFIGFGGSPSFRCLRIIRLKPLFFLLSFFARAFNFNSIFTGAYLPTMVSQLKSSAVHLFFPSNFESNVVRGIAL